MLAYLLALVSGFVVKSVDWLEDEKKSKSPVKYALALVYGVLIGYIIGTASFSGIFLAALVGQVFARKIDTPAHELGFVAALFTAIFFDVPPIDIYLLSSFIVLAFLDEVDYIGKLRPLIKYRPFLKIGALLMVFTGRWDYFVGIILFDLGYIAFPRLIRNIK